MWDSNGIPIDRHHDNPMLNTIVYWVKEIGVHKASLAVNYVSENIFSQVYEEGNILLLFYEIVDHHVDVTDTMYQYALVVTNNGWNRIRETNEV